MKQKINKKGNTVLAVVCLVIGLALIAGGIYLLATDGDTVTGGVMLGLGVFIVVLFACTMYLIVNFEKLQQKAEERAEQEGGTPPCGAQAGGGQAQIGARRRPRSGASSRKGRPRSNGGT